MLRNFLILGTQRTGSTALVRSLTFHPDVACGDEWTQRVSAFRKLSVTAGTLNGDFSPLTEAQRRRIEPAFSADTRWLGFKILFRSSNKWLVHPKWAPALWLDRFGAFRRWIAERPALHVIHITREDPIDWLKSKYLADRSRAYAGREYPAGLTVRIDPGEALRRLAAKSWIDTCVGELSRSNPYLKIRYEDFLESDRAVVHQLMSFLSCDPGHLRNFDYRKQQKQSKRPASDYIANYDELRVALRGGGFLAA